VERTTIAGETEELRENLPQRHFVLPQIPHDQVRFRTPDRTFILLRYKFMFKIFLRCCKYLIKHKGNTTLSKVNFTIVRVYLHVLEVRPLPDSVNRKPMSLWPYAVLSLRIHLVSF
jgi:hypothetical protein